MWTHLPNPPHFAEILVNTGAVEGDFFGPRWRRMLFLAVLGQIGHKKPALRLVDIFLLLAGLLIITLNRHTTSNNGF